MTLNLMSNPEPLDRVVIPFPNACEPAPARPVLLDAEDQALLEAARWWLIRSRLTAKAVVEEACFLLAGDIPSEASAYATAFFRLLDTHAKRELRFFTVGVKAVTNDELWFLQMLNAAMNGDHANAETLVGWRVGAAAQRRAAFLICQLGRLLQKNDLECSGDVVI
ncbi:MAG: hypothetical protein AAGC99_12435 [Pseudomonadota bacterium]